MEWASLTRAEHNESTTFAGQDWSGAELRLLRHLWGAGVGLADIGRCLGRSAEAVRSRARRLRLAPRRPRHVAAAAPGRLRPCLTCKALFPSQGAHNRLCDPCRERGGSDFQVWL